jgi:zinc transport system permease protein
MTTVNSDIAHAEGHTNRFAEIAFLILVAVLVAIGLRVVGALLIVALIIVPPAAARPFARTPEAMALWSAFIAAASAPLGVAASYWKDIPTGPCIVLAAIAIFLLTTLGARISNAARARA